MLSAASEQYRAQTRLIVVGASAARRAWRSGGVGSLARTLAVLQVRAARDAEAAVGEMVAEQRLSAPAVGRLAPEAFTTTSEGLPLVDLLEQATTAQALTSIVATQIADTTRAATSVATAARPRLQGYVRHVGPTCCSRCAVLAGRFYRYSDGFLRHPRCRCTMVPTTTGGFGDVLESPDDLWRQGRITDLTAAERMALEDGADLSQLVNIRRGGVTVAGRVKTTTEGTTKRGVYGRREIARTGQVTRDAARRQGAVGSYRQSRAARARLTPQSIYDLASDRADAIRMLRQYGYIL